MLHMCVVKYDAISITLIANSADLLSVTHDVKNMEVKSTSQVGNIH